jgi:hypothetical protein
VVKRCKTSAARVDSAINAQIAQLGALTSARSLVSPTARIGG